MVEKNLVVDQKILEYRGLFEFDEMIRTLDSLVKSKGYELQEKKAEEKVSEEEKEIHLELRPLKRVTNYQTLMIKVTINAKNLTEEIHAVGGKKRHFHKGNLSLVFDGWSLTDFERKTQERMLNYLIRGVISKYLYRSPTEGKIIGGLKSDVDFVFNQLKSFLNLYKYQIKE